MRSRCWSRWIGGLALFLAALPLPAPAQETPARGGTILDSLISEPDSLDPGKATLLVSQYVLGLVYERLVYIGRDGRPKPWLAESWKVSEDGRDITFTVRPGVKFTDGTPLDAAAVKFTLERFLKLSKRTADIGPLEKVDLVGSNAVRLRYSRPFAPVFSALDSSYLGIVSPTAVKKEGERFGHAPVGSGPFVLKGWKPGSELVFERNPHYRNLREDVENRGAPYVDGWIIKIVTEEGTRMAALETGALHMSWAPFEEVPRIKKDPRLQLFVRPKGTSYIFLEFNTHKAPFNDVRIRRAIGFAVNPQEILEASYLYGDLITGPMPIGVPGYSAEAGKKDGFTYDPNKALALFKEAGWTKGADGKLQKNGQPFRATLMTWVAPQITRAAQVIQAELQQLGLDIAISQLDAGSFLAKLPEAKFDIDLMRQTFADAQGLTRETHSPGRWNHYSNPALDKVLEGADSALDPDRRMALLKEAQEMVLKDGAIIPLFSDSFIIAARREVRGYKFDATGVPMYYDIWLKK